MPFDPICIVDQQSTFEFLNPVEVTRTYRLKGFATRFDAEQALSVSPLCPIIDPDYPRLVRRPFEVRSKVNIRDQFDATVSWQDFIPPEIDREILSGSISLITQNVKNTYRHVGSYGPGTMDPMDAGGLLNVTSDGANGVDVEFPVLNFNLARLYPKGTFNLGFLAFAQPFAGRPNNAPWRGFDNGTIRLSGVDGSEDTGEDHDEIVFSFQASPTITNIQIDSPLGMITVPEKQGFAYLHIQSVEHHDDTTGITSFVPHTAHVDELTDGIDLNALI